VWLGDIPLATLRPKTGGGVSVYYIHSNYLNTPRLITEASSSLLRWKWDAEPFGGTTANDNPVGAGDFAFDLRFPGRSIRQRQALHYNYYRDYDPSIGCARRTAQSFSNRFTSASGFIKNRLATT
jgi:uncharacterized protein RhaS with RHS repeats